MRRVVLIGGIAIAAVLLGGGCDRPMDEELCPQLAPGDLVISEIRGEQTVKKVTEGDPPITTTYNDPFGEWIELYNASGASIDLYGLHLHFLTLDGSNEATVIVRSALGVAASDRVVLGFYPVEEPQIGHIDYEWFPDFVDSEGEPHSLYETGVIDAESCGVRIDRVRPDGLPRNGTWSFPVEPPDATANDDALVWCDDGTGATDRVYANGTPGEANRPCP